MLSALLNVVNQVLAHPLNRHNRVGAIVRFLQWQIAARTMPAAIAFPFVDQTRLLARKGQAGATGNWYSGLHELDDMGFVLHALRPTETLVDVGANVGEYTVLAAGAVGASVIAVEPIPSTFADLAASVGLNGLNGRVELHCVGLSDTKGVLRFTASQDTTNHVADNHILDAIQVPVTTLDYLCKSRSPALLKIDVEGYELMVLKGGAETLQKPTLLAIIIEVNGSGTRYGISDNDVKAYLRSYGFTECKYDAFTRALSTFRSDIQSSNSNNRLFVRDIDFVQTLCREAPRYRLVNGTI